MLGAATVIVDDLHRVLLVKHAYGERNWELPGGRGEARAFGRDRETNSYRVGRELIRTRTIAVVRLSSCAGSAS